MVYEYVVHHNVFSCVERKKMIKSIVHTSTYKKRDGVVWLSVCVYFYLNDKNFLIFMFLQECILSVFRHIFQLAYSVSLYSRCEKVIFFWYKIAKNILMLNCLFLNWNLIEIMLSAVLPILVKVCHIKWNIVFTFV